MSPSDLLTPDEAAAELRISRKTVYDAVQRGLIRATKFGRLVRIKRAEIDRLKDEGYGSDQE